MHKHQKVLVSKAVHQVGKVAFALRSANGHFIPPFFEFPRQSMNDRLMLNALAESESVAQPKS